MNSLGLPFCCLDSPRLLSPAGSRNRSFPGDCSQLIPSRGTAHDSREQLCLVVAQGRRGFVWCEFLAVRATPFNASCCLASAIFSRKLLHPRSHSSWPKREGSQVATGQLRSNNRVEFGFVMSPSCGVAIRRSWSFATMQLTWAEDRALLRKQPERRPRGQDRMGRHDAALFRSGLAPMR
jgi:hypothetical protein